MVVKLADVVYICTAHISSKHVHMILNVIV